MNNEYSWWKIEYENVSRNTMHYHYVRAKDVISGSDGTFLILDESYFYLGWNCSIIEVSKLTVGDLELLDHVNYYIQEKLLFQSNDSKTRKAFEDYFCGLIRCDDKLNTPEVIDRNEICYEFDGYIYEYGKNKAITFLKEVNNVNSN